MTDVVRDAEPREASDADATSPRAALLARLLDPTQVVVFDGAMGTMLYARGVFINQCYDELNLRSPELVAVYLQGALLMGGFVALYNFVGYRLLDPPFSWTPTAAGLVFLAYLAGTWSSPRAGRLAARVGRLPVLAGATAAMAAGVALTSVPHPAVLVPASIRGPGTLRVARLAYGAATTPRPRRRRHPAGRAGRRRVGARRGPRARRARAARWRAAVDPRRRHRDGLGPRHLVAHRRR